MSLSELNIDSKDKLLKIVENQDFLPSALQTFNDEESVNFNNLTKKLEHNYMKIKKQSQLIDAIKTNVPRRYKECDDDSKLLDENIVSEIKQINNVNEDFSKVTLIYQKIIDENTFKEKIIQSFYQANFYFALRKQFQNDNQFSDYYSKLYKDIEKDVPAIETVKKYIRFYKFVVDFPCILLSEISFTDIAIYGKYIRNKRYYDSELEAILRKSHNGLNLLDFGNPEASFKTRDDEYLSKNFQKCDTK